MLNFIQRKFKLLAIVFLCKTGWHVEKNVYFRNRIGIKQVPSITMYVSYTIVDLLLSYKCEIKS